MLKIKMKTALQIILAKIMVAVTFHRIPAFISLAEWSEAWNNHYGS
jgi:hypothetical protein